jgi:predicted  nucleic acid-binding Zn-ribbon protein
MTGWINCTNCGHRFSYDLANCPKCGVSSTSYKPKSNGTGAKIGIAAGVGVAAIIVVFLFVTGGFKETAIVPADEIETGSPSIANEGATKSNIAVDSTSQSTEAESNEKEETILPVVPISQTPKLYTRSTVDALPSREDVGTKYRLYNDHNTTHVWYGFAKTGFNQIAPIYINNNTGFEEANRLGFDRERIWSVTVVKFDSYENASKTYDQIVSKRIERGNYEELETTSIDAKCYGAIVHYTDISGIYDVTDIYCVKTNLYYHVLFYETPEATRLAKIVANKIDIA